MNEYQIDIETDERIFTETAKASDKSRALVKVLNKLPLPLRDKVIRVQIIYFKNKAKS